MSANTHKLSQFSSHKNEFMAKIICLFYFYTEQILKTNRAKSIINKNNFLLGKKTNKHKFKKMFS